MMILNQGLNRMRDLMSADMDYGQAGTDSTLPIESQTTLQAAVAATKLALTVETSDKVIKTTHVIPSTVGNSNTYVEWEVRMNDTSATRTVTQGLEKDSNHQFTIIKTFAIVQK